MLCVSEMTMDIDVYRGQRSDGHAEGSCLTTCTRTYTYVFLIIYRHCAAASQGYGGAPRNDGNNADNTPHTGDVSPATQLLGKV